MVTVFSSWRGITVMNSAIRDSLCQDGLGLTSSGAPGLSVQRRPLNRVAPLFQTPALEAFSSVGCKCHNAVACAFDPITQRRHSRAGLRDEVVVKAASRIDQQQVAGPAHSPR